MTRAPAGPLPILVLAVLGAAAGPAPSPSPSGRPKDVSRSPGRPVLPAAVRDACAAAGTVLRSLPGTSVDQSEGPIDDPLGGAKRQGCAVHARGTFAALKGASSPDVRLGEWYSGHGWSEDPGYDADGPDGTAFGYTKASVLCFVHVDWDGGDDSDPDYVPEDWFEVGVGCAAKPGTAVRQ